MLLTRRDLLKSMLLTGGMCMMPFGSRGWALAASDTTDRHMIMVLLRGAVDGLSVVVPYRENYYYSARSSIAIPAGGSDGAINLDGFFGLNPSLASVIPLWQNQTLAFIHASGSPSETRSHFEAQDIMETALLHSATAKQGWMNSLVQNLPDNRDPTRALSFGNVLPRVFQGHYDVATVPTNLRPNGKNGVENPQVASAFASMYGNQTELGQLYQQALSARTSEMQDLSDINVEMQTSGKGAPNSDAFVIQASRAGEMVRKDPHIQLVFMDVGGWDTHVNQGNTKGQLANRLQRLGDGLAAMAQNLGDEYKNTVILVMSEFGRTVAQNGNGGTDHGHGNVAWLMGGGVRGGRVYSRWPGLNPNQLWQGRDLAVTTDFRSIIGAVAYGHFGLNNQTIGTIIDGYQPDAGLNRIIV